MVGAQLPAEFRVPLTLLLLETVVLALSQIIENRLKKLFCKPWPPGDSCPVSGTGGRPKSDSPDG